MMASLVTVPAHAADISLKKQPALGEDFDVFDAVVDEEDLPAAIQLAQHGVAINIAVDPRLANGLVLCGKPWIAFANLTESGQPASADLAGWSEKIAAQWRLRPLPGEATEIR